MRICSFTYVAFKVYIHLPLLKAMDQITQWCASCSYTKQQQLSYNMCRSMEWKLIHTHFYMILRMLHHVQHPSFFRHHTLSSVKKNKKKKQNILTSDPVSASRWKADETPTQLAPANTTMRCRGWTSVHHPHTWGWWHSLFPKYCFHFLYF